MKGPRQHGVRIAAMTMATALWQAERDGHTHAQVAAAHGWSEQIVNLRSRDRDVQALLDAERTWHGATLRKAIASEAIDGAREAITALRAELREGGATSVQAARALLEVVRVLGPASLVSVSIDQRNETNVLIAMPTHELVRDWRASVEQAERALTAPPEVCDPLQLEAPSEERPSDEDNSA